MVVTAAKKIKGKEELLFLFSKVYMHDGFAWSKTD